MNKQEAINKALSDMKRMQAFQQHVVNNCKRMLLTRTAEVAGNNHLVMMPGNMFLSVQTEFDKKQCLHIAKSVSLKIDPTKASHFTIEDAENVAANTVNAYGEHGTVIKWEDACALTAKEISENIEFFNEYIKKAEAEDLIKPFECKDTTEVKYDCIELCNMCGGENEVNVKVSENDGLTSEAQTKCKICGFNDYWAYGFFNSSPKIKSMCNEYTKKAETD